MRTERGKYIAEYNGKDIGTYNTAQEAQAAEKDAAAADANKGSNKLTNTFNQAGSNGDSIDDLINKHYTNGTWNALLKALRANGADDKTIAGIIKSKGLTGAKAQEWLKNYEGNNPKSDTPSAPSTGNMVDGWYSWIDPYTGTAHYNKLSAADATATRKQFMEKYPGYNIQWAYHKNEKEAKTAAAGKKGEPAKPKTDIQVPPKKDGNNGNSGTGTGGTSAQPQTEELDKFFASLTYTDEKSFDEALNKIDNKIKELQAQIGTLPDQKSKDIANATLNELMKRREDYIAEAKKSTDSGIKGRAEQAGDAHISPEQGNADKQKVAEKFKNGEELTAEEWATLDANRTDIAAMIAESTGGDYNAIQDDINKKVYENFKNNANKAVDDLANSESEIDPSVPEGKGADKGNPPGTGNTNLTGDTGGKGNENKDKMAEFWKAFKAGAFRAYPMLQAIGDALSQQAKMTMDRANILTGKGSDLSVYEGKDPSEYFFNEDYEYRQAFLDAEAGNYEGVKELLLKGKVTLEQVAAALKLTDEDVEKIFGQEMRGREADTVSKELSNEKVLKDEIKDLRAQVAAIDVDINKLQGRAVDVYLDVLAKYIAIYEGKDTLGASKGTTTTKNDSSGGNIGGSAGNSVVGLNASINGGHQEGTTEASNASRNKDLSALKALPKGEEFAQMAEDERNKYNDELIANLQSYKQSFLDQIADDELQLKNIRTNQNAAQTGGKNTILNYKPNDTTTTPTSTPTDTTTTTDASGGNGNATEQQ